MEHKEHFKDLMKNELFLNYQANDNMNMSCGKGKQINYFLSLEIININE